MHFGIHLPQYGRTSGPEAIRRAAQFAEELGFRDVWVSDHLVQPASQTYPSPYLYDPLMTLCWAAAATSRIGLGTSVIVAPQHEPLALANALSSLDALSGGRLTVAVGVGWSEAEFEALGQSFHDRGSRTDEIMDLLRASWSEDPITFSGNHYRISDIRLLPKPAHPIPIWVGGLTDAARRRAITRGDGFHAITLKPPELAPVIARLREERPDPSFPMSFRTGWDPQGMDQQQIVEERDAYEAAGVQHVVAAPWRTDLDSWLDSMETLATILGLDPARTTGPWPLPIA